MSSTCIRIMAVQVTEDDWIFLSQNDEFAVLKLSSVHRRWLIRTPRSRCNRAHDPTRCFVSENPHLVVNKVMQPADTIWVRCERDRGILLPMLDDDEIIEVHVHPSPEPMLHECAAENCGRFALQLLQEIMTTPTPPPFYRCPLCMKTMTNNCWTLECAHRYHSSCLHEWICYPYQQPMCVVCRGEVTTANHIALRLTMPINIPCPYQDD